MKFLLLSLMTLTFLSAATANECSYFLSFSSKGANFPLLNSLFLPLPADATEYFVKYCPDKITVGFRSVFKELPEGTYGYDAGMGMLGPNYNTATFNMKDGVREGDDIIFSLKKNLLSHKSGFSLDKEGTIRIKSRNLVLNIESVKHEFKDIF